MSIILQKKMFRNWGDSDWTLSYELTKDDAIIKTFSKFGEMRYYCYYEGIIYDKFIDEYGKVHIHRFPEPSNDEVDTVALKNGWEFTDPEANPIPSSYKKGNLRLWKICNVLPNVFVPQTEWRTLNYYPEGNKNHKRVDVPVICTIKEENEMRFKKKIDWRELSFSLGLYGIFILSYFYLNVNWWQFVITFAIWRLIDLSVSGLFERIKKIEDELNKKDKCV